MPSLPKITRENVFSMNSLPHKPVGFIQVYDSDNRLIKLVVKREAQSDRSLPRDVKSIAWTSKIMKNVQDSLVKMIVLDEEELVALRLIAADMDNGSTIWQDLEQNTENSVWVKMPNGLGEGDTLTDGAFTSRVNGQKLDALDMDKLSQLIANLDDDGNWHELGKVLAADLFNGNTDRFTLDGTVWGNKNNLLFRNKKTIGLDVWDPFSRDSQANLFDFQGGNSSLDLGCLKPLNNEFSRKAYVNNIVLAVGKEITKRLLSTGLGETQKIRITFVRNTSGKKKSFKIKCSDFRTLYLTKTVKLEEGMVEGIKNLKGYLLTKINRYAQKNVLLQEKLWEEQQRQERNERRRRGGYGNINFQDLQNQFQQIQQNQPQQIAPPPQLPPHLRKAVPNGIIQRMVYLGWLHANAVPYL